jgi:parallel beta-helix repeat protein
VTRGVWIDYYSTLNYFGNNTFINGGICIQSTTNTGWSNPPVRYNQIIDRTNTVNGKPIYYFHKEKGITIDGWSVAQIILSECSDFTIKNLNISYATIGIELAYSKNINVSDVVFFENAGNIILESSNNSVISNVRTYNFESVYQSITLHNSSFNIIENSVLNSKITLNECYGCAVINNTCYGIYLEFSDSCTVTHSTCNNSYGIILIGSSWNNVTYNYCSYNYNSIEVIGNYNIVTYNNCSNSYHGIIVWGGHNTITGNTLVNNSKYGILIDCDKQIDYQKYNRIHHNRLINNGDSGKQANDTSDLNFWNTSTEGNYWSDWTGPDDYPPFGIVDSPYELDGNKGAKDYFPTTTPGTWNLKSFMPISLVIILLIIAIIIIKIDNIIRKKKIKKK